MSINRAILHMGSNMRSTLIDIEVVKHYETKPGDPDAGAILVSDDGDRKKAVWLPKSAVEVVEKKGSVTITLPEQLALDKGLI